MYKSVLRITVIRSTQAGAESRVLYDRQAEGRGKRKHSFGMRPVEKLQRRLLDAEKVFVDGLVEGHDTHSRKRRDGWLRAAPAIFFKAQRKALKRLFRL
jgi:hypothetical protein